MIEMPHIASADPGGCPCEMEWGCVCMAEERVLRLYSSKEHSLPAMTAEQREECLQQIERVEGYTRQEYQDVSEADLARGVLFAWTDYCRDKGLL